MAQCHYTSSAAIRYNARRGVLWTCSSLFFKLFLSPTPSPSSSFFPELVGFLEDALTELVPLRWGKPARTGLAEEFLAAILLFPGWQGGDELLTQQPG